MSRGQITFKGKIKCQNARIKVLIKFEIFSISKNNTICAKAIRCYGNLKPTYKGHWMIFTPTNLIVLHHV